MESTENQRIQKNQKIQKFRKSMIFFSMGLPLFFADWSERRSNPLFGLTFAHLTSIKFAEI